MPENPLEQVGDIEIGSAIESAADAISDFELPEMTPTERTGAYDPAKSRAAYAARNAVISVNSEYRAEILSGKRLPGGRLPLRRLTTKHKEIILMHISGQHSVKQIAMHFGCSINTVYRVLSDPLAKPYLEEYDNAVEMDIQAMRAVAVDVVREGLQSTDKKLALTAVDKWAKLAGIEDGKGGDVKQNITIVNNARSKFLNVLKDKAAAMSEVIEGEYEEVSA